MLPVATEFKAVCWEILLSDSLWDKKETQSHAKGTDTQTGGEVVWDTTRRKSPSLTYPLFQSYIVIKRLKNPFKGGAKKARTLDTKFFTRFWPRCSCHCPFIVNARTMSNYYIMFYQSEVHSALTWSSSTIMCCSSSRRWSPLISHILKHRTDIA